MKYLLYPPHHNAPLPKPLPPKRQWVHYGGRRHTQLAELDDIPTTSHRIGDLEAGEGVRSTEAGPSRKRGQDPQEEGSGHSKRGNMEVATDNRIASQSEGREQGDGPENGKGNEKGKGKRPRGKERMAEADADQNGATKRRRTQGSQPSLPGPPI